MLSEKKRLQHTMQAVRTELTAASTGWQNAKDHLQKISQERDILHNEVKHFDLHGCCELCVCCQQRPC